MRWRTEAAGSGKGQHAAAALSGARRVLRPLLLTGPTCASLFALISRVRRPAVHISEPEVGPVTRLDSIAWARLAVPICALQGMSSPRTPHGDVP